MPAREKAVIALAAFLFSCTVPGLSPAPDRESVDQQAAGGKVAKSQAAATEGPAKVARVSKDKPTDGDLQVLSDLGERFSRAIRSENQALLNLLYSKSHSASTVSSNSLVALFDTVEVSVGSPATSGSLAVGETQARWHLLPVVYKGKLSGDFAELHTHLLVWNPLGRGWEIMARIDASSPGWGDQLGYPDGSFPSRLRIGSGALYPLSHYLDEDGRAPTSYTGYSRYREAKDGTYVPPVAENGSYFGELSTTTWRPKTTFVRGYFRSDGTYVGSHFRSRPRR